MSDSQQILEFNAVVEHFDVTPRTLRYYEYLELIAPIREGRKRFYTKREIARIELILRGRRFGFKLEEIRQWLEMYDPQTDNRKQIETWVKKSRNQLNELFERREELDQTINELKSLLKQAEKHLANTSGD